MSQNPHPLRLAAILTIAALAAGVQTAGAQPPGPTVEAAGSRFLAVTPQAWPDDVALKIFGFPCFFLGSPCPGSDCPVVNCLDLYVQADGSLATTPVFQSVATWGTVFVHGPEIVPEATYTAAAEDVANGRGAGSSFATTFKWGDTNGDCIVDEDTDVQCVQDAFQGIFSPTCTPQRADLRGASSCDPPDGRISIADILSAAHAANGQIFTCPGPCEPMLTSVSPEAQRVNELLTLEGSGFGAFEPGVSKVLLTDGTDTFEAPVPYVWRDDFIQVRMPAGDTISGTATQLPGGDLFIKIENDTGRSNSLDCQLRTASGTLSFTELTEISADEDISTVLGSPNLNLFRTKDAEVGDVDGDGWPDLMDNNSNHISNDSHSVVRFNQGDGTFSASELEPRDEADTGTYLTTILSEALGGTYPDDATTYDSDLVDLTNDGLPEIVQAIRLFGDATHEVRVLVNDEGGAGLFLEDTETWLDGLSTFPGTPDDVAHTDVDGDGWVDVAFAFRFSTDGRIFLNEDGTSFETPEIVLDGPSGSMHDVFFLDADDDGFKDVVLANESGDAQLFLHNGLDPPGFPTATAVPFSSALSGLAADFDADGLDDLVFARDEVTVFFNDPLDPGNFTAANSVDLPAPVTTIYDIELGDIDLDGSVDIIAASLDGDDAAADTIRIWLNDGTGTFTDATAGDTTTLLTTSEAYQRLSADLIDLDLDGDLDLYITGADGQDVGPDIPGVFSFGRVPNQLFENEIVP